MAIIDINKIIKESNSAFLHKLSPFSLKLIKRLIYLDKINNFLSNNQDCKGVEFHNRILKELNITVEYQGLENLPDSSRCFFVANHPFGILDGLMLTKMLLDKYGDCKAIGNEAFAFIPPLKPYVIINKTSHSYKDFAIEMEQVFASDMAISHFPAGYVSRLFKGKTRDIIWKKTFVTKSVTHKRDIVPLYFGGHNSTLFYSVNIFRRLFGMKTNIEYTLLPHEFFNKKNRRFIVKIGKPIPYTSLDNSKSHQEWADEIREKVYALKDR